jgi:hypothetical protein
MKAGRLDVNSVLGDVYQMYIKDRIGEGSVCQHCRRESSRKGLEHIGPVPIFHVGENFAGSPHRLLILGSVAYGWDDILLSDKIADPSEAVMQRVETRFRQLILNPQPAERKSKVLGAIRAICDSIYGSVSQGYGEVAISNVIKCNAGNIRGGAPTHMAYYCAHSQAGLMVTRREIDALRPRKIVSIAGSAYNPYVGAHWGLDPRLILLLPHPAGHISYAALAQRAKEFVLGSGPAEVDRLI